MDEKKEVLTNMLDELVECNNTIKKYSNFDFKEKYLARCSSSDPTYLPYGIFEVAESVGEKPEYRETSVIAGMVMKKYTFVYKGVEFWGCVEVGPLEGLV